MSYHESPEQRQIRELRARVSNMESQANTSNARNKELQNMLERERKKLEEANAKLERQTCKMNKLDSAVASANANILALDKEIKEKEALQRKRIADLKVQYEKERKAQQAAFEKENQSIREAIMTTRQEMQESLEIIRSETDIKMQAQELRIQTQMKEVEQGLREKIRENDDKIESILQNLKKDKDMEHDLAVYWAEQANRLITDILEMPRGELFSGKELERYSARLNISVSDLKNERYSSAADGARAVFYDTLDLKERVLEFEMEWNSWYNSINQKEIQLIEALQSAENRIYTIELDDINITDENGIDYWTRGQLSVVRERIMDQHWKLEDIEDKPIEYLQEQMNELLALSEELALIENASHTNFTMAVERYRMASSIGDILGESHNMIDCSGDYFGEENRESYHAIYENPITGDQAAIVATPVYGDDGIVTNHIELLIGNANNDPVTRAKINNSITAELQQNGYTGIGFPCVNQHGNNTRTEIARVGNIKEVTAGKETARPKNVEM